MLGNSNYNFSDTVGKEYFRDTIDVLGNMLASVLGNVNFNFSDKFGK